MDPSTTDPLSLLRLSISAGTPPTLSTTTTTTTTTTATAAIPPSNTPLSLSSASHLLFTHPTPQSYALSTPTRFHKTDGTPVDLRSIFFAWQHREDTIPDYISKAQSLGDGTVTNLAFLERLELVTWLEGGQEESEFIKALPVPDAAVVPANALSAAAAAAAAAGGGGVGAGAGAGGRQDGTGLGGQRMGHGSAAVLAGKVRATDPRLLEIYSYERVITNRNTLLRGIKPTDFSHVRKQAEDFITRLRTTKPTNSGTPTTKSLPHRPGHPISSSGSSSNNLIPSMPTPKPSKPSRSKDPIILLSPSASSLLTMANIKPFLEHGTFTPSSTLPGPHPSIHHVSRLLPSIHATQPLRFIIVDSPEKFKPDYWDRVVAVFTTGQAWQFKGYKWSNPVDLFREVRGYYVGWEGEKTPDVVRGWGAGVRCYNVERARRFRDREVCEKVWEGVEVWMRGRGWGSGGR